MQRFYHHEVQQYEGLLQLLNGLFEKYNTRDPDVLPALQAWLDKAIATYRGMGKSGLENMALSWKADLVTALRNINPATLERVTQHRYQMQVAIAYRLLQAAGAQLQSDLQGCRQNLDAARSLAAQLVTAALQNGVVTDEQLEAAASQEALEELWKDMAADAGIALGQKRLLMQVSRYDVWILLEEILASIAEPA
ncbi:hypothetical protein SAMN05444008_11266 [Cnuella takakiae]|uniref:Uncharacterized protein n=1 Tax=Cnuella takakiae TaxID=1302690 RepID=A0A1M5EJI4_9BACT|nr:hypothetical protein [Cnuella takakiae]OLY91193.1 hypothetical protein BUE76_04230 [Cnuella takakiae]SHF79222.1 hypothetical protein SAMN05444008_11266 [Cnuella takakiae]